MSSEHPKTQAEPLAADACTAGIKEVLDSEGFYVGPPVGVSMWPMLRNRRDAIVLMRGRHIEHLDGVRTPLSEQDYVAVTPLVAGG